ncbi:MAG: hypothetical protein H6625_08085 [Bdellovibrionaceae bacterium]|nr:hypothetical protein [Pseudobdellovibrionaceae bacterium]
MKIAFPEKYTKIIEKLLSQFAYQLNDSQKLATAVLELSDIYNSRQIPSNIWKKPNWVAAYLVYFFPLNYLRSLRALLFCKQVNFANITTEWWELGSGCGATFFAYLDHAPKLTFKKANFLESSTQANEIMKKIWNELPESHSIKVHWHHETSAFLDPSGDSMFVASYSLSENSQIPTWAYNCRHLLILEPSLQEESRKLMNLRQHFLSKKFHVWAPCTHQEACPLLTHSRQDWCFDRFFIEMPDWFLRLEDKLPMKNRSLTYSYLAMSKETPPLFSDWGRLIGDTLKEKGKTRQAYCRNSQREFLSWLKKEGETPLLPRGHLLRLSSSVKKGNELRPPLDELEILDLERPFSL